MGRARHCWQDACEAALAESDPSKVIGRAEYAIMALERRYAEWDSLPGTPAELNAIHEAILALESLMKEESARASIAKVTDGISPAPEHRMADKLGQVRRLFRVPRS